MISRKPIVTDRLRKITGSFSWIDHRLLVDGHLALMSPAEMLLYFFLVLVGDRHGISFYGYDKICSLLKTDVDQLISARAQLIEKSLIAFDGDRYQVLQLPDRVATPEKRVPSEPKRSSPGEFTALADIFKKLAQQS